MKKITPLNYTFTALVTLLIIIASTVNAKTIKVAVVAPLTGEYSAFSRQILTGTSQAAADISQRSLSFKGLFRNKIEVVPFDDHGQAKRAIQIASEICKSDITAIVGHVTVESATAVVPIYNRCQKLLLLPNVTSQKITHLHDKLSFRIAGRVDLQADAIVKFLLYTLKKQQIAILFDKDNAGKELADKVAEFLSIEKNPNTVYQELPKNIKDYHKVINKLIERKVDVAFISSNYHNVAELTKIMYQQSTQIPILGTEWLATKKFLELAGGSDVINGALMSFYRDTRNNPQNRKIYNNMRSNLSETEGFTFHGYAAIEIIAKAVSATNSLNAENLGNYLYLNSVPTVIGNLTWDTNGDLRAPGYRMFVWHNGEYLPIAGFS